MATSRIVINTVSGAKVVASADLTTMTSYILLEQQDWFEHEMAFIRAFALPGMYALDIGANHGVYGLNFAACLQGRGHVWAFEPTAAPFSMLTDSVTINAYQQVLTALPYGLSDQARDAQMYVDTNSELNSLHGHNGITEQVRLETLDEVLPRLTDATIDFVKLDAEGEEISIIKGGARFFAEQSPLVMFEVRHGSQLNHGLWDVFLAMGYQLYRHLPGLNTLVPVDVRQPFEPFALNLFAAKADRQQTLSERGLLVKSSISLPADTSLPQWQDVFKQLPYAQTFMPHWTGAASVVDVTRTQHTHALNCYLGSKAESGNAALRVALLENAVLLWRSIHATAPGQLSVGLCLARATFDLGLRTEALQTLVKTMQAMASPAPDAFSLPFLPPVRSFDQPTPQGSISDWLSAALMTAYEQWRAFSSFYTKDAATVLQPYFGNPNLTAELRRRYVLHTRRSGMHVALADSDLLLQRGPENLNPEVWRGLVQSSAPQPVR